ncbi:hypothetical protein CLV84_3641 [Neolewinella xylanilytica]|uniref:MOSC domain-containing protein n=1 Tax=Neolewinella xylanilytica TaxID=1514080 RepID=A0A2S6I6D6_9BACT|nr:MOSC N-terminal beta barrel domain-containing protein [Neolewinella xylanilytica]PPK86705.1 hypothetical protein CLV84_3641 [Neolewinella xylanilytica]
MRVSALYRYPVKSLGGTAVNEAIAAERGFQDDRRWMLVDADGRFISQRQYHHLAKLRAEVLGATGLRIGRSDSDTEDFLTIAHARPSAAPNLEVTVWDDTFMACTVAAPGLPDLTGIPGVRLVYMNEAVKRPVDKRYAKRGETVSFADGYPYLIATTASLKSLSDRLGRPVNMLRFRPNIVVEAEDAFVEDGWSRIRVGSQGFYLPKPCARCIMVTVDPAGSGDKDLSVLSELAAYRNEGNKTLFGMNAICEAPAGRPIRVGDAVQVLLAGSLQGRT